MEWDWSYNFVRTTVLHHVTLTPEQCAEWGEEAGLYGSVVTATCGRAIKDPCVPGIFSRMSMKRCDRCCDRLGYPRGIGSPKNDEKCRPLVEERLWQWRRNK